MLLVDMEAEGVSVSEPDSKMGNFAQLTAEIALDNVFVPDDRVLGSVGSGLRSALGALMLGRMGIGAIGVAMAQRAFDVASDYGSRRHVFGKPVAGHQYWQYRFAEHAMGIETARSLYQKAALAADRGEDPIVLAAMAKLRGSSLAVEVSRDAIQICGGYGFARRIAGEDWPLESIYRDAKIGEIYEGANEIQKWIIARRIFGRNVTG